MNQVVKDFACILIVFGFCALFVYGAVGGSWPSELGVQPGKGDQNKLLTDTEFTERFESWAALVAAVSLVCSLGWYVLGEWGPRSKSTGGGWLFAWIGLLLVVLLAVIVAFFWGPPASENGWVLDGFFAAIGLFFFYVATALFSPTNTKYVVPGSTVLRKGW